MPELLTHYGKECMDVIKVKRERKLFFWTFLLAYGVDDSNAELQIFTLLCK